MSDAARPPTVLLVDDEALIRWSLRQRLEQDELAVVEATTGEEAIERFRRGVDAVILDFALPDLDGLEVLDRLRAIDPRAPVIMLTGHSNVDRAVAAMQRGAHHFAAKPCDLDALAALVGSALEPLRLRRALVGPTDIVGESPAIRRLRELVARIGGSPSSTVLITGESGTGKDVAARAIHAASARSGRPFMNITCSAMPEALLESELFGHEKGAFTDARQRKVGLLELADGGTVFLDEIGEMSPALQAKLLRFLEEKAFRRVGGAVDVRPDVRVIAATHRDLAAAIESGAFRADLYYRLAVLSVHVPPLRERGGDVALLARHFVARFAHELHKKVAGLSPDALAVLQRHGWPGNVRELRNAIERAVLLCDGSRLEAGDVDLGAGPRRAPAAAGERYQLPDGGLDLTELERDLIVQALERTRGNQVRAARLLGLTRDQIRYRMQKFGLLADANG